MFRISVEKFLQEGNATKIVDVRSPAEYQKGHIPGAINIPIFTDLERAKVGTAYKKQSREEAISLGLELVGPKLKSFTDLAKMEAVNNKLYLYCWRGGMRSEKMAWLFDLVGLEVAVLEKGYKNYRAAMEQKIAGADFIVLQGPTGSGKTEILQEIEVLGEQVIDLEGLANHKGSAFGGLGQKEQPSTQQFQNEIFAQLFSFNLSRPIWLESESATIGKVYLPELLWQQMNKAKLARIEVSREFRIRNIIKQYGSFGSKELCGKVKRISQRLGGKATKEVNDYIQTGDLESAVDLLLQYYDKSYSFSASTHKTRTPINIILTSEDPKVNAEALINEVIAVVQ